MKVSIRASERITSVNERKSFFSRQPLLSVPWRPSSRETSSEVQLPRLLGEEGKNKEEVPGSTSATVSRIGRPGCAAWNSCRR